MSVLKNVRIVMPTSMRDNGAKVVADLGNGEEKILEFYPDEISFVPAELEGMTIDEAAALKHRKDLAYLQS